jgi:hypothetical protein
MHAAKSCWTLRTFIVGAWLASATSGCLLFPSGPEAQTTTKKSLLTPIVPPREAIEIEVYFVDRRIGDPLIGEGLWGSLFAVTAVSPEVRDQLTADGFRFAMSPSRPPRSLQTLMKLSNDQDPSRRVLRQRYVVPAGQETILVASQVPDGTPLTRRTSESVQTIELNRAQCLFRVTAERVEEGWAKLVVLPEILHGETLLRPQASDQDWQLREGQRSMVFYQDRLSAEINEGELIVLGLDPDVPDGLASHFFRSDVSQGVERLILIRVVEMRKVDPVRVTSR